ncbi:MAG: hypothetical protein WBH50_18155 [Fuerstiella sp.]|jgi:hypothetical protein
MTAFAGPHRLEIQCTEIRWDENSLAGELTLLLSLPAGCGELVMGEDWQQINRQLV